MHYDMCMRSIERIEDLLAQEWENFVTFAHYPTPAVSGDWFETLDFEGVI